MRASRARTLALLGLLAFGIPLRTAAVRAGECGDAVTPEQAAALEAQERAGAYLPGRGAFTQNSTRYVLQVPVTVHIVRRSDGTGGLADSSADNSLALANTYFIDSGVQFTRPGAIRYINSNAFYSDVNTSAEINSLKSQDVVANTINLYFTQSLADESGGLCGKSSFTTDAVQGIVFENDCTTAGGNISTVAHELGHYFDLYHTHETAFGPECPGGLNCATAGDKVCDTPPDPGLDRPGWVTAQCAYAGDTTVCNGQAFAPDVHNLMSYAPKSCRDHFTFGQLGRIRTTLINLRPSLVAAPGLAVTWVDFGYFGTQTGSYAEPFNTLAAGVNSVNAGGTVVIKAGSHYETLSITKAVTIDTFLGPSRVGP